MTKSTKWRATLDDMDARVQGVLRFERFYSRRLREGTKGGVRAEANVATMGILLELLHGPCSATWLGWRLDIDPGYVSRTLRLLELEGYIATSVLHRDRRQREIRLTEAGRRAAKGLLELEESRVQRHSNLPGLAGGRRNAWSAPGT